MARIVTNCAFTYMLGHIVTKEQGAGGVSFRCSGNAAEVTYRYRLDKIEDDQGILWILFDICHQELLTVNDLWRYDSTHKEGKRSPEPCLTR